MRTETQRLQADESSAPALRNVARIYTQGRYRRASVLDGPGDALVRRDDAMNLAGYWRQVAFLRWQALEDMTAQRDAAQASQAAEIEALKAKLAALKVGAKVFGTFVERADGTTEFRRAGVSHTPTALGYKITYLYSDPKQQAKTAEIQALLKDSERLIWMIFHSARVLHRRDGEYCHVDWYDPDVEAPRITKPFGSARDAIDAAMQTKEAS